ncbi:MAG: hypothetical protein JRH20_14255 [Deltaproteobacteria bacterium]|nr:hypothetical protein [Deltaproteobacteria bacterium]
MSHSRWIVGALTLRTAGTYSRAFERGDTKLTARSDNDLLVLCLNSDGGVSWARLWRPGDAKAPSRGREPVPRRWARCSNTVHR